MIVEPIKPIEEWTVGDWSAAFDTLTELHSAAERRAETAAADLTTFQENAIAAMECLMTNFSASNNIRIRELQRANAELTAERDATPI